MQDRIVISRIAPWRKVIKRFWFVPSANVSWGEPFGWTQNNTSPSGGLVVFMMSVWLNLRKTNLSTGLWMLRRGRTVEHLPLHFRWVEKWGLQFIGWHSRADSTSRFYTCLCPSLWKAQHFPPTNRICIGALSGKRWFHFRGLPPFQSGKWGWCICTRWAPTRHKYGYNPFKWPYKKWVTGATTLLISIITYNF